MIRYCVRAGNASAAVGGTEVVIGRSSYCSLVLDDPSVSRIHASIKLAGNRLEVVDLGTRNGTLVNGNRIEQSPVALSLGDEIKVGRFVLTVELMPDRTGLAPHETVLAQYGHVSPDEIAQGLGWRPWLRGGVKGKEPAKTPAILVVVADPEAEYVMGRFLTRTWTVAIAKSLEEGRQSILAACPEVLITDPDLPDGLGTSLIDTGREIKPWMQALVVCSLAWAGRSAALIGAGAGDVATKPFDVGTVEPRVDALIRRASAARNEFEMRNQLIARLRHVERITTLGTMAAKIAHEISNPLTAIAANASIVQDELNNEPIANDQRRNSINEAIGDIQISANTLRQLVMRMRSFSRREDEDLVISPLSDAVDMGLMFLSARILQSTVSIQVQTDTVPVAPHYQTRLAQAVMNAVANSLDAVGGSGNIRVSYVEKPDSVAVHVADDGPGMAADVRAKAMQPFFTTKQHGTGLGMSIITDSLRDHGGRLELGPGIGGRGLGVTMWVPRH